jgi:hypothetical protein
MKFVKSAVRSSLSTLLAVAVIGGLSFKAEALTYNVNTMGTYLGVVSGNDPGPGGFVNGLPFFYKAEPGKEEGPGAALVATAFSGDEKTATLTFSPNQELSTPFYLVLKAGPEWACWDISNYDPSIYDVIQVVNDKLMNPPQTAYKDISHISLYGTTEPYVPVIPAVPDAGAMLGMLGMGMVGLGLARRRLS